MTNDHSMQWFSVQRSPGRRRQGRDQVDAAVVPDVCRKRSAASASCACLQPRQLPADAGDAGTYERLVADHPQGEADQDRRQGGEPQPLHRVPDGRGRGAEGIVPGNLAADRRTATKTGSRVGLGRLDASSRGRSVSECQEKWPDRRIGRHSGRPERAPHCAARLQFRGTPPSAIVYAVAEFHLGNVGYFQRRSSVAAISVRCRLVRH